MLGWIFIWKTNWTLRFLLPTSNYQNDFLAHEVRNPVSAAMAACSFVKTAVNQDKPLLTEESLQTTRDDVNTIENALKFVNDLLRSMLDMHRLVFDAEAVH